MSAPNSFKYGYQEPRTYLDISTSNASCVNNQNNEYQDIITTIYSKVRVLIIRLKNKKISEKIDCTDFRFTISKGNQIIIKNEQGSFSIINVSLYGHAMNQTINRFSKAICDL